MKLDDTLKELSLEEYEEVFEKDWDKSETLLNSMDFLTEKYIVEHAKLAEIDTEFIPRIVNTAKKIDHSTALKRLFTHCHYLLFVCQDTPDKVGKDFPDMQSVLDNEGFIYNLLLALSGMEESKKYFKSMNMSKDVIKGAFKDIAIWSSHNDENFGYIGLTPHNLNWERGLMRGNLFRLGRLQFNIRPFGGRITVYRNKKTKQVQAFVNDGIAVNSSGLYDGVDGVFDKNSWKSSLVQDKHQVTGNPLTPQSIILQKKISLDLHEWDKVLEMYDPILDIHIPAGESMDMQKCSDSINYSVKFFAKYFPEKSYKGWACNSWFLDNQFEKILPNSSNIVQFQRELYLYPLSAGSEAGCKRIFGENGIKNAPKESSMHKAVADFMRKGGKLRQGGGFFLKEDMPWGKQLYRKSKYL